MILHNNTYICGHVFTKSELRKHHSKPNENIINYKVVNGFPVCCIPILNPSKDVRCHEHQARVAFLPRERCEINPEDSLEDIKNNPKVDVRTYMRAKEFMDEKAEELVRAANTDVLKISSIQEALPTRLRKFYQEDKHDILSSRERILVLDAMWREKLSHMDTSGATVNMAAVNSILTSLIGMCADIEQLKQINKLQEEFERSKAQSRLETDIRKITQELAELTKAETAYLVTMNGAVTQAQLSVILRTVLSILMPHLPPGITDSLRAELRVALKELGIS